MHQLDVDGVTTLCGYKLGYHMLDVAKTPAELNCRMCQKHLVDIKSKYPRYINAAPVIYAKSPPSKN